MSMTEAIGRIHSIEASLQQLAQGTRASTASSPASNAATAADAASFASALSSAMGTSSAGSVTSGSLASGLGSVGLNSLLPAAGSTMATAGAAAVGTSGGSVSGDAVVAAAKKYIGVPYVWGGTNPAVGMDCSGFVQRVFKDLGVELPRVVSDQMQKGTPVASLAEAKPGDLLVSYGGEHISIYLGNGKAIDAPVPGQTIQIRDAWEKYSNLTSIRRIVPAGGS
ncbi:NlpC/P60 family protein [Paenarthrobacter nitroguajacolicus]|uniref:NlpC/P60 family protein n=1 Tax=Paenarthrobacter nitroguajacolicus TaxID=211146 RepID=A0A558GS45_PAENT|nr:C40 family peptidase [Paenarthrobacter nitroguajacolicus]TVU59705.1 NlpC/P60 family protein [Paenarthrobacter nitroguajacolicus]